MSRNTVGSRKIRWKRSVSGYEFTPTKANRSFAGLIGFAARDAKLIHIIGEKGDKARAKNAILIYIKHKHEGKSITDLSQEYRLTVDQVRRVISSTRYMFAKWKGDERWQVNEDLEDYTLDDLV